MEQPALSLVTTTTAHHLPALSSVLKAASAKKDWCSKERAVLILVTVQVRVFVEPYRLLLIYMLHTYEVYVA